MSSSSPFSFDYSRLLAELQEGVWSMSYKARRFLYFNPALENIFGGAICDENHCPTGWWEAIYPPERDRLIQALNTLKLGEVKELHYPIIRPDGAMRFLRNKFWRVRGTPARFEGVITDVTPQTLNQPSDPPNSPLEAFFLTIPTGIAFLDFDLRFRFINEYLAQLNGKRLADHLNRTLAEVLPEQVAFLAPLCEQVINTGEAILEQEVTTVDPHDPTRESTWSVSLFLAQVEKGEALGVGVLVNDISQQKAAFRERQAATQALLLSEQQLQKAQRIAHIGNWEFDVLTGKISWSEEMFRIYGWDPEGETPTLEQFTQNIHPDDQPIHNEIVSQTLATGAPFCMDYRIYQVNSGELRHLDVRGEAIRNEQGEVIQLFGTVLDITERRQAELALQQREEFLRSIYEGISQAIFMLDVQPDGEFYYVGWNPFADQLMKIPSSYVFGKKPRDLFGEEVGAILTAHYTSCVKRGESITYEESLTVEGENIWFLTTLNPLRNEQGKIYRIVGTAQTINEQKLTEMALKESQEQLQASAKTRDALQQLLASQIRQSLDLQTVLEATVAEIYNLLPVSACTFAWYHPPDETMPDDPIFALGYWEVITEAKVPESLSYLGQFPSAANPMMLEQLKQGKSFQIEDTQTVTDPTMRAFFIERSVTSALFLPIPTNNGLGVLNCMRSVEIEPWDEVALQLLQMATDQIAIAINQSELYQKAQSKTRELEQTLEELQKAQTNLVQAEKMSSLGQLVAGIAHEINNPINFIYGNLEPARTYAESLLGLIKLYQETYPEPTPEIAEAIEEMDLEFITEDITKLLDSMWLGSIRIRDIVQSLRTFARLDESGFKSVNIHENLDSTLMVLRNELKTERHEMPNIMISRNYEELPSIYCDIGQLNQVFFNLITNGIDAIKQRNRQWDNAAILEDPGCILINTTLLNKHWIKITISDNGVGIDPNKISQIFDPFYTTKGVGNGTGLGLSVSYQIIVNNHQGRLYCESELGKGTKFIIELPIQGKG
ncbi:PAS domain-containing protein [Spirulina subsalsa]|uniref:PAS domain-containing protein n=1 Tax=Spirulina subsalsa TaxID=54311 RepID=UPI0002E26B45|nr:PAS domain-containing protein [Spirulina subsalsa]